MATINALLPQPASEMLADGNAEHILASRGQGKKMVVVGHFPFTNRLKSQIEDLVVLDEHPVGDDLPADAAPQIVPEAEIIAITGMALINHTLEDLLKLCSPEVLVLIVGPTTPLSPVLFSYGVDMLCGSVVMAIEPVLQTVSQGGNFPQVHRAGVRLVTFDRSSYS
jgi:hypothetical protein